MIDVRRKYDVGKPVRPLVVFLFDILRGAPTGEILAWDGVWDVEDDFFSYLARLEGDELRFIKTRMQIGRLEGDKKIPDTWRVEDFYIVKALKGFFV